jgi:hypothetical protein
MKSQGIQIAVAAALVLAAPAYGQGPVFEGPVSRAACGPGSQPEPPNALQGAHLARGMRVNGKRFKRVRGRALEQPVRVKLPKGHSVVRIVARGRSGKRYSQTRDYTRC